MPRISVILPCYNSEKFIAESIESVLNQTYADFELIVLNDGSDDRSKEVILSYNDERIVYVENPGNIGLNKTLNKGIVLSSGEFVARMDSDDIAYSDRFKIQIDYFDCHPEVGMVGGWIDFFPTKPGDGNHKEFITYFDVLKGWCINHPTVMIRKDVIEKNDLFYNDEYKYAADYELWSRIVKCTKIVNIQKSLIKYRWHENNMSVLKAEEMRECSKLVMRNMLEFLTEDKECQRRIWKLFLNDEKWAKVEKLLYP